MKRLIIFTISAAFGAENLQLSGTEWVQIDGPDSKNIVECPIRLSFEESKYFYINECSGGGQNKVVEFGQYTVGADSMWFENRRVVVGAKSILGEDAVPVLIDCVQIDGSVMRFQVGTVVIFLDMED